MFIELLLGLLVSLIFLGLVLLAYISLWGRKSWKIEFKRPVDQPLPEDPTLIQWLQSNGRLFVRGKWRLIQRAKTGIGPAGEQTSGTDNPEIPDISVTSANLPAMATQDNLSAGALNFPEGIEVLSLPDSIGDSGKLQLSIEVPAGQQVRLTIETLDANGVQMTPPVAMEATKLTSDQPLVIKPAVAAPHHAPVVDEKQKSLRSRPFQEWILRGKHWAGEHAGWLGGGLFALSLIIYLLVRIVGLDKFPIYFFTDEAIHTILAEDLVKNGFRYGGKFLPTFFSVGSSYALNSISVYLQVIPYLLFGKSVFVTRLISVLVTLGGAAAVGLILKDFLKVRYWWAGVLVLSATPTWFLHSRTAFEYMELAGFYAIFLFFYLCYRVRNPRYLYLAIIFAALVFYTHGLGEFLIGITGILLLLIDLPYHWKNRVIVGTGLLLVLLLALPYYRFTKDSASIFEEQLRTRGSYWLDQKISIFDKFVIFSKEYLYSFSPKFWLVAQNGRDLSRHLMKGYGNYSLLGVPFLLYGLYLSLRNVSDPAFRTVLVALVAAPFGAAQAQISILRVMWMVIPLVLITTVGLSALVEKIERPRLPRPLLASILFVILAGINIYMLRDSLANGPTWFTDYGLYGMQYGASQVFGETAPKYLVADENNRLVVTPTWANGTDNFVRFFLNSDQQSRIKLDSIDAYLFEKKPVDNNLILILTPAEYQRATSDVKFKQVEVLETIPYPDGSPGFFVVRLAYADNADEIFAAEKFARSQPVEGTVLVDGQEVRIHYSQIDMGQPSAMFDGDTHTLMRGLEANPFIIDIYFPEPRSIESLSADFANMDYTLTAELYADPEGEPQVYETTQRNIPGDPHLDMIFDQGPELISRVRLVLLNLNAGESAHIHIRELNFNP